MAQDTFKHCPNCQCRTFLRTRAIYRCPKCFRIFCDKCREGNWLFGYRCPHCTYLITAVRLPELRTGCC